MDAEPDLTYAEVFARLAEELSQEPEEEPTLERIAQQAVATVPNCDYCAISVREPGGVIKTLAATDPIVTRSDELQYQFGEGPCLDVIWELDTCLVPDLENEQRWPGWAPRAAGLGIGSILSIRLETSAGQALAGLNLYAERTHAFEHSDVAIASVFARHASAALTGARAYRGARAAMWSRQTIGIAQGILMQRFQLTLDQAFEVLRRYSQNYNVKLKDLAEHLAGQGHIVDDDPGAGEDPLRAALGLPPNPLGLSQQHIADA